MRIFCVLALSVTAALGTLVGAQVQTEVPPAIPGAKPVTVQRIKVRGAALEGNLEGNAVARDVLVFLPPGYAKQKARRYPVLYALHGYSIGAEQWAREIHVPQTIGGVVAEAEKPTALSRPVYEGRRAPARCPREVGGQCAAGFSGSVCRRPPPVSLDCD